MTNQNGTDPRERELLSLFRALDAERQARLLANARDLASAALTGVLHIGGRHEARR